MVKMTIRIDDDIYKMLEEEVKRQNKTKQGVINKALVEYFTKDDILNEYIKRSTSKLNTIDFNMKVLLEIINNFSYQMTKEQGFEGFISQEYMRHNLLDYAKEAVKKENAKAFKDRF